MFEEVKLVNGKVEFDYTSVDARIWAKAFCLQFPGHDEGTMLGWFANAIVAGYHHIEKE